MNQHLWLPEQLKRAKNTGTLDQQSLFDRVHRALDDLGLEFGITRTAYKIWRHPKAVNFIELKFSQKMGTWIDVRIDSIPKAILNDGPKPDLERFKKDSKEKALWNRYCVVDASRIPQLITLLEKIAAHDPDWRSS